METKVCFLPPIFTSLRIRSKRNREKENDRACEGGARTRESPVKIESSPEERGLIEPIWGRPE